VASDAQLPKIDNDITVAGFVFTSRDPACSLSTLKQYFSPSHSCTERVEGFQDILHIPKTVILHNCPQRTQSCQAHKRDCWRAMGISRYMANMNSHKEA
jgi:hypothetical protein